MIERNLLVEEWEYAFEQDEWLTMRYPKMKDLKSNDGDAASPLEKMSNGRISRSMITTELQNFVPVGQLCHVKAHRHHPSIASIPPDPWAIYVTKAYPP